MGESFIPTKETRVLSFKSTSSLTSYILMFSTKPLIYIYYQKILLITISDWSWLKPVAFETANLCISILSFNLLIMISYRRKIKYLYIYHVGPIASLLFMHLSHILFEYINLLFKKLIEVLAGLFEFSLLLVIHKSLSIFYVVLQFS